MRRSSPVYGVPCVVNTKLATARLADGQIVRVDGAAGTVTVVSEPGAAAAAAVDAGAPAR